MFKSSPRLSKRVDYLLNLVGIHYTMTKLAEFSIIVKGSIPGNVIFYFTVLEIINYLTAVK